MSWKITDRVFNHSQQTGNALLLLIAISTHCDRHGTNAFPSIDTLAKKIRMSRRTVFRLLKQLEASKEITIIHRPGATSYLTINLGVEQDTLFDTEGRDIALSPGRDIALSPLGVTQPCHPKGPLKGPLTTRSPGEGEGLIKIDPEFEPPEEDVALASRVYPTLDLSFELKQFRDHYIARGLRCDGYVGWVAAWKTWIRREGAKKLTPSKPLWQMNGQEINDIYGYDRNTWPSNVKERMDEIYSC